MEMFIQKAMNDDIIKEGIKKYGVSFENVKKLGGFESFIYEFEKDDKEYVIRYTHSGHRSYEHIFAELEFIDYLDNNGANVSTVVHTIDDELLFKIPCEDNQYFTVCVFTKAKGTYVQREDINDEFLESFGEAIGKLHRLTKTYHPEHRRYHFYEEDYIDIGRRNLKEEDHFVIEEAIKITEKIKSYEMDIDSYGLIHTDLHFGNMYYDQKQLTFFDFDDASYKHFISDIAIIIFYTFRMVDDDEMVNKVVPFLKPFLKGYERENKLDKKWIDRLNDFFRLREVILYMVIMAAGDELVNSNFGKSFLGKFRPRIKNNTPFIDIEHLKRELWNT